MKTHILVRRALTGAALAAVAVATLAAPPSHSQAISGFDPDNTYTPRNMHSDDAAVAGIKPRPNPLAGRGYGVFTGESLKPLVPVPTISDENVMNHLKAFQKIADENGGDRSHGRPGYKKSVEYVRAILDKAGYQTSLNTYKYRGGSTDVNLIADLPGGDENQTVIIGAHLDGVPNVPAISDNGTGSAAILETALALAKSADKPKRHVRFIWFGGEELGMVGSYSYVRNMPWNEQRKIAGYLNYDMTASPNGGYFIFDADNSDGVGNGPGPVGSDFIEHVHQEFYKSRGIPTRGWDFDGIMDYGSFSRQGIAAGGIATGARSRKTAEEAKLWGGEAGKSYDACYHLKCDDINNLNLEMLKVNNQAVAYATWVVAGVGAKK